MGQQQLLLLVLGIVLVGIAVVAGLSAYDVAQRAALDDVRRAKMVDFASQAQAWKRLHPMQGGQPAVWRGRERNWREDPDSFHGFKVTSLGLTTSRTSGSDEYVETVIGCFRFSHGGTGVRIVALETGCDDATASLDLWVRGVTEADLEWP